MDFATIGGMIAAAAVVAVAIFLGGNASGFVDVPSVLIVIGGGLATTILRFPIANTFSGLLLGAQVAFTMKKTTPKGQIDSILELADLVRKKGPLALESAQVSDPILAKGKQMVADGYEPDVLVNMLERERDLYLERLDEAARVYKALGDAAPAFGMIGTLIGLVQMLANMDDPSTIGPAMAVALLTTLYGALISNVIALPIVDKLNGKAKTEELNQTLAIDGIVHLRANRSPQLIKEMLIAYLPEKQRHLVEAEMAA